MSTWRASGTAGSALPPISPGAFVNSLLRFIENENISLLAAGGYGHSRLGEWAYGGVTRDLLAESPVCCLFSH